MSTVISHSLFSDFEINLFRAGKYFRAYERFGSHPIEVEGQQGTYFAVWAPNARAVAVIGNFNGWNRSTHPLNARWDGSGIWEGFIPNIGKGELYKYAIDALDGRRLEKGDPFAHFWEVPPNTSSIVWDLDYKWKDEKFMKSRRERVGLNKPMSVYEVHLGSWRKKTENGNSLSYREMGDELVKYVADAGFTHIELLPVMEHPYFPSWGYQVTGYFAPTSRFGQPEDFMYLVDKFHEAGIGVILDWVPSHFPNDAHGLADFDGTHLFDHADPRQGFHPDWKSCIFNYGRNEVRSFLISNALFWLDQFHADGLRVDAVASMLYLDYSRNDGEWIPNQYGGNENLEAISFLRDFNEAVYRDFPDAVTIAEESTAWSGVSRPVYTGGLGFEQKWMMGWMHDTLAYFKNDPIHRKYHHNEITFSLVYAFTENFQLPLSHDEVVHGKGPLIDRMPGDKWQRFANLRLLYGYMFSHPGTQLLFMGAEFGQTSEWSIEKGLDWSLLEGDMHKGVYAWIKALNSFYRKEKALHELQFSPDGFDWIDLGDHTNSVLSYVRKAENPEDHILIVCNFTPVARTDYRLGAPDAGSYEEILSSDAKEFQGTGDFLNPKKIKTEKEAWHGRAQSISINLPPLGMTALRKVKTVKRKAAPKKKLSTTKASTAKAKSTTKGKPKPTKK